MWFVARIQPTGLNTVVFWLSGAVQHIYSTLSGSLVIAATQLS
jgi:hypothetical protein